MGERTQRIHRNKMYALFAHAAESGDGIIDCEEFKDLLSNEDVRMWLGAQELNVSDAELVFNLLDASGDQEISAEELIQGVGKLKGAARAIDLACLARDTKHLASAVGELRDRIAELCQHSGAPEARSVENGYRCSVNSAPSQDNAEFEWY